MNVRSVLLLSALLVVPLQLAFADSRTEEWITKARAAVGQEGALNAINAVRFLGTVETVQKTPSKADPVKLEETTIRLAIDIIFQSPYRQRIVLRSDKGTETTVLDGYEGWFRRAETGKENQSQIILLETAQIKRLRANTWENLSFFRGIESHGGRVDYQGEADVDAKKCTVLVFVHSSNISFTRYFDQATGLLVKTVTENGGEIREEGEIMVNGIHFPKTLINKSPDGQTATITFDSIKVNEPLPAAEFAVPDAVMP
jgi:outer membrane lipoprotein-sorting protein